MGSKDCALTRPCIGRGESVAARTCNCSTADLITCQLKMGLQLGLGATDGPLIQHTLQNVSNG